ncbi:MAG: NYN domain-containing protein [Proteobacteria bacterium]|nr:NYN domain-containing protein [Pseudomonadota bacterium]
MDRVAIYVDAGYLFAQGSVALTGSKQPRSLLSLDDSAVLAELTGVADAKTGGISLLRVYWYDGAISYKGPTAEQARLAHMDNVKLRLGFVNSSGQQKGVDSLIVTDLIELARHGAITDAVLVSGDEDVRIGVQIAQSFGVRMHLIGITPSRGSQSKQLLQESDTTTEWDKPTVEKFLSVRSPPVAFAAPPVSSAGSPAAAVIDSELEELTHQLVASLNEADIKGIQAFWATQRGVPPEFDGRLLAGGRAKIGRDLDTLEKRRMRTKFNESVRERITVEE